MKSEKTMIEAKAFAGLSRRKVLHIGAAVAATSSFWFNIARATEEKIKIGFPVPLTGPYGAEAKQQAACAQIAVDDFNAAGGLNGRMAELLVRDDKLNAGEAATRTLELIEKDQEILTREGVLVAS